MFATLQRRKRLGRSVSLLVIFSLLFSLLPVPAGAVTTAAAIIDPENWVSGKFRAASLDGERVGAAGRN